MSNRFIYLKNRTAGKIAVIILKFEQCGFTKEYSLAPDPLFFTKVNKSCMTYTFPITSFPLMNRETRVMGKVRLMERNRKSFYDKKRIDCEQSTKSSVIHTMASQMHLGLHCLPTSACPLQT